jgi:NAD+ kinase
MSIQTVGIVTKPRQPEVARVALELVDWLAERKIVALLEDETARQIDRTGLGVSSEALGSGSDLIVVVGGDGTLLAAARMLNGRDVPILAINHGSLGFLTAAPLGELYPDLERTLAGQFTSDRRMMLNATVIRGEERLGHYRALNDVVINKGTPARIIEVEARVDDQYVSTFRADGLIISTPTGSTAYNLSAGGPIVHPRLSALILTPICSHTLTNRPIVLPEDARVSMTFTARGGDAVQATIDGQVAIGLEPGDCLEVVASDAKVRLIAPSGKNYFDVLRGKLKWG